MKKMIAALLAAALCLSACAGKDVPDGAEESAVSGPVISAAPADKPITAPTAVSQPLPAVEPDYDLYISDQPIPTVEGCLVTDRLPVLFINNTGEDGYVLDIPRLEKLDGDDAWAEVPYREGIGFCGTPSRLPADGREWSEDISMLWGTLEDGQYRLSYDVGPTFDTEETVSGEFTLYTPENNRGLPLAPTE